MICDTKRYKNLRSCPPALSVVGNPREVKIVLVGQLGHIWRWIMRKDSYGDFKICHGNEAYCNSHIGYPKDDIEWVADELEKKLAAKEKELNKQIIYLILVKQQIKNQNQDAVSDFARIYIIIN